MPNECMECVEGQAVALGLCADCLAGGLADAIDEITSLTRELEEAREILRDLADDRDAGVVWTGTYVVCAYCYATDQYDVEHFQDCPIESARRALATDADATTQEET